MKLVGEKRLHENPYFTQSLPMGECLIVETDPFVFGNTEVNEQRAEMFSLVQDAVKSGQVKPGTTYVWSFPEGVDITQYWPKIQPGRFWPESKRLVVLLDTQHTKRTSQYVELSTPVQISWVAMGYEEKLKYIIREMRRAGYDPAGYGLPRHWEVRDQRLIIHINPSCS